MVAIIKNETCCTKQWLIIKIELWTMDCVLFCFTWKPVHASEPVLNKGYISFWNSGFLGYDIIVQW
jgi:hypothetical protein